MYAMQYEIALPADYDMGIIHERVATKGHLLDDFAGLGLKAYLVRERESGHADNQYAPFYLWHEISGMNRFLWGAGFRGLRDSFGRPAVRHWTGLGCLRGSATTEPVAAVRQLAHLDPDEDPAARVEAELETLRRTAALPGVHTCALAIDPAGWQLVRFTLGEDRVDGLGGLAGLRYRVLHLSVPELGSIIGGRHW